MAVCSHDRAYKDYTGNPIPTSFFSMFSFCRLHYEITLTDGECKDGVTCVVFFITCLACTLPSLHLVSVVFGTAIPTFLYIFGKCFSYFNYKLLPKVLKGFTLCQPPPPPNIYASHIPMLSSWVISCCTSGVAVALNAIMGISKNICFNCLSSLNAD